MAVEEPLTVVNAPEAEPVAAEALPTFAVHLANVHRFDRKIDRRDLPSCFPNPFDTPKPSPWAREAARQTQRDLCAPSPLWRDVISSLNQSDGGKMFGILIVADASNQIGFLKAFSGTICSKWQLEGFVEGAFDAPMRQHFEGPGEARIKRLSHALDDLRTSPWRHDFDAMRTALLERQALARGELVRQHADNKRERAMRRRHLSADSTLNQALERLAHESRHDTWKLRQLDVNHHNERREFELLWERLQKRERALERWRHYLSRALMKRIHDCYVLVNANGARTPLRALFKNGEPPSGAGDCAGPKLLAAAYRHGLRPIELAEFWCGAQPGQQVRTSGQFYAACEAKCGPILTHMLAGLDIAPGHSWYVRNSNDTKLQVVFEDEWLVVVDKPHGLLSAPGRDARGGDCVLFRLNQRDAGETQCHGLHRLDMDTSGLLVFAKTIDARLHVQRQFLQRAVTKEYVAIVQGAVPGDCGRIELPLRPDFDDRPRQLVDFEYGKLALTEWRVLERESSTTRLRLIPRTGRTHQLRVHMAHRLGLGAPIVGDRLYGDPGERLMLHATKLAFVHPCHERVVQFESPAPF